MIEPKVGLKVLKEDIAFPLFAIFLLYSLFHNDYFQSIVRFDEVSLNHMEHITESKGSSAVKAGEVSCDDRGAFLLSVSENLIPSIQRIVMVDFMPVGPENAACTVPSSAYAPDARQCLYALWAFYEMVEVRGTEVSWQRGVSSEPSGGHSRMCEEASDPVVGGLMGELEESFVLVEHLLVTRGIPATIAAAHGQVGKEL